MHRLARTCPERSRRALARDRARVKGRVSDDCVGTGL